MHIDKRNFPGIGLPENVTAVIQPEDLYNVYCACSLRAGVFFAQSFLKHSLLFVVPYYTLNRDFYEQYEDYSFF